MTKDLRDELREKIPESLKTREYNLLLNFIKENDMSSVDELKSFLDTKIGTLNMQLVEKRTSTTMTSEMRNIAKEVDTLKSMKNQFFKFL